MANKKVVTKTTVERVEHKTVETKTINKEIIPTKNTTPEEKFIEELFCAFEDYFQKMLKKLNNNVDSCVDKTSTKKEVE